MIYPPKRDLWIVVLLATVLLLQLGGALLCLGAAIVKDEPGLAVPGVILATVGGLLLWMVLGSAYEITETHLLVHVGPLRWRLPLESIAEVNPTIRFGNDFGWGLAFSLDRLRIKCHDRWLPFWISPEDKPGFIAEMQRAVPGLKVTSDR